MYVVGFLGAAVAPYMEVLRKEGKVRFMYYLSL